jgi:hypothetical protein
MLALVALVAAIGGIAGSDGRQPIREGSQVRVLMTEDPAATIGTLGKNPFVGRVLSVQGGGEQASRLDAHDTLLSAREPRMGRARAMRT